LNHATPQILPSITLVVDVWITPDNFHGMCGAEVRDDVQRVLRIILVLYQLKFPE